jgi:hypothetical protein
MSLLQALFSVLLDENLLYLIRVMTALVHCSLLGGIAFEEIGSLVLSWWCLVYCYRKLIIEAGLCFR